MKKIITLTILSAFLLAGTAFAQQGHGGKYFNKAKNEFHKQKGKHQGGPAMILKMADKLELTEKQTTQLETMAVDFKLEQIELKSEIAKEHVLMKALRRNDDASEREVFAKIDKISALNADSKKMQFTHRKAVQDVLTDEQTDKLKELRKNHMKAGMSGRMGGKGHGMRSGQCDIKDCGHCKNEQHGGGHGKGHGDKDGNIHKG